MNLGCCQSAVEMPRGDAKRNAQFHELFGAVYGERWHALHEALVAPTRKIAVWNRYTKVPKPPADAPFAEVPMPSGVLVLRSTLDDGDIPRPPQDDARTAAYYIMDLASALIVEALELEPFHHVLDLCAAPGGKTVAAAQYLTQGGTITANEVNAERNKRLRRTVQEHLPPMQITVNITQRDGTRWHQPEAFHRVLVDAPCSSERHLLAQPDGLAKWSPNTTVAMAEPQVTLLLRGLETLKVGGVLVYSTCSISPAENDDVVRKALSKSRAGVEVVPTKLAMGEPTAAGGWMVLPDVCDGAGPMYCCRLRRVAEHRALSDSDDDSDDEGDSESD